MKNFVRILMITIGLNIPSNSYGQVQDSSNTIQQNISVKPSNEEVSNFDRYFDYFIDLLVPIIAIVGVLTSLKILKKKLIENHITKALIYIQEANRNTLFQTSDLIDDLTPKTFYDSKVSKEEIEQILEKINPIYKISLEGNSDSYTMLFLLKHTLLNTLTHYMPPTETNFISSKEVYYMVLYTLEQVVFFSTQVVQIPKSSKVIKDNLINKRIRKYVSNSEFSKYKHFKQGLIDDANSAHYLLFYNEINKTSSHLLRRSAFQIFRNTSPIKKLLFLSKIYAPLELTAPNNSPISFSENHTLFLIGFKMKRHLETKVGSPIEVVELIYSNPEDFGKFVGNLSFENLSQKFKDVFIPNSGFCLGKGKSMTHQKGIEAFSLKFEREYLEILYKKNIRKFKKKMK